MSLKPPPCSLGSGQWEHALEISALYPFLVEIFSKNSIFLTLSLSPQHSCFKTNFYASPSLPPFPLSILQSGIPPTLLCNHAAPVLTGLKDPLLFPCAPQSPIPSSPNWTQAYNPLLVNQWLSQSLICPTAAHSPPSSNNPYCLVQDLRAINNAVMPVPSVIPNLITHHLYSSICFPLLC